MKVVYDKDVSAYLIKLEDCEKVTLVKTDDIAVARDCFVNNMTSLFNNAIQKQLQER